MKNLVKILILGFILAQTAYAGRYYNSDVGRFIQRDSLGYVDGMSLYAAYFAQQFAVDPMGTTTKDMPVDVAVSAIDGYDGDSDLIKVLEYEASLRDVIDTIKKQVKKCECVRTLTLLGHGNSLELDMGGLRGQDGYKRLDLEGKDRYSDIRRAFVNDSNSNDLSKIYSIHADIATDFGKTLKKDVNFCKPCKIFLAGCRTSGPVAIYLAKATGCTVYGTIYPSLNDSTDPKNPRDSTYMPDPKNPKKRVPMQWHRFSPDKIYDDKKNDDGSYDYSYEKKYVNKLDRIKKVPKNIRWNGNK